MREVELDKGGTIRSSKGRLGGCGKEGGGVTKMIS
jgi:hypothetical protein